MTYSRWRWASGLLLALAVLMAAPTTADAGRKIFLNGVDLGDVDVRNQKFQGCMVRFDAQGNLHITVKGFKIAKKEAPGGKGSGTVRRATSSGIPVTRRSDGRYFVVSKVSSGKPVPFNVWVYINGRAVRRIGPDSGMTAVDVTSWVKNGDNKIQFVAKHDVKIAGKQHSYSPTHKMEIVLGQGHISKGMVVIRTPHIEYKRNAAERGTFNNTYRFKVK
jgi:hypothetical protein